MQAHDEILCRTRLSAWQILAVLTPSPKDVVFGILMFVIWGAMVPFMTIAIIVLVGLLLMALFKLLIVIIGTWLFHWRVSFDGNRVSFLQGSHLAGSSIMIPEETMRISVIDSRWLPHRLQIVKANGETLEMLYGVAKSDLNVVAQRLQTMLDSSQPNEETKDEP